MFGGSSHENLKRFFADQFEPNDHGYLYRQGMKGPPIQVSAAERDAFVAAFDRRARLARRAGIPVVLLACVVLVIVSRGEVPEEAGTVLGGVVAVALLGGYWWLRQAPMRALERRPALGPARDAAEMRRIALQRIGYPVFLGGLGGCVLLAAATLADGPPLTGWHPYALAGAAVLAILLGWRMAEKWRQAREMPRR